MTLGARVREGWTRFWYAPMDAIRLDAFGTALVWTLLLYVVVWLRFGQEWLTSVGFHPSPDASPRYAPGLPLLPQWALWPFAIAFVGAGLLRVLVRHEGIRRGATAALLAGTIYVTAADPISAFTINRIYIVSLLVLLLAPSSRQHRRAAWPVRVLQVTILLHYFVAGWCKAVYGDWLDSNEVLWGQVQGVYRTQAAAWLVQVLPHWAWSAQQHLALGFELLAPVLLGVRRLRPIGFVLGLGLHAMVALSMDMLIYFSLQMACFYLLFVDPEGLRRAGRTLGLASAAATD